MPTSGDTDIPIPRLPSGRLLQVPVKSKLAAVSLRMEQKYGPPRAIVTQPELILKSAASKLARSGGDIAPLTHRERKASVELCWGVHGDWKPGAAFVRDWLKWADSEWTSRAGASRIAVSYVRNYDTDSEATVLLARWLGARVGRIGGYFGDLFRHYGLHDGERSDVDRQNARGGKPRVLHQGGHASQDRFGLPGSGIVVAVVGAYGGHCSRGAVLDVSATTKALVALVGENGLGGKASEHARDVARVAMVAGIVGWAGRTNRQDAIDVAIDVCIPPCRRPQTVRGTMARHSLGDGRDGSWLADRAHDREHVPGNQKPQDRPSRSGGFAPCFLARVSPAHPTRLSPLRRPGETHRGRLK